MVRTEKLVLKPHWHAHLAAVRFALELSRYYFSLRSFFTAASICASMFVWRRGPRLLGRPGDLCRPREAARPRLSERGEMQRQKGEEPGNGCGAEGAAARALDRLIMPYDPTYNLEPALFLSDIAWECLNKGNSQMP